MRKTNGLKYSEYIEECSHLLAETADAKTDSLLPYFILVQRFYEEVNDAFDYDNHLQLPQLDAMRIELLAKTFGQKLNQLQLSMPAETWSNSKLTLVGMISLH
jgi:hypothetical protein